jgi:uncharacterized membrane protein
MSDDGTTSKSRYWPAQGSRWWSALLIASLAVNLFIGGAVATRIIRHDGPERFVGASYTQLIPRRFFAEIPRERRRVLLDILKQYRKDFRGDRDASEAAAAKLADALVASPMMLRRSSSWSANLLARRESWRCGAANAALDIIALLSADERKILADAIRDRAKQRQVSGSERGRSAKEGIKRILLQWRGPCFASRRDNLRRFDSRPLAC